MKRSIVNVDDKRYLMDSLTGEILNEVPDDAQAILIRKHLLRQEAFVLGIQKSLVELAQKKLKPTTWRYLILLIATMDFENLVKMTPARAAEILGVSRQHIYLCKVELKKKGLLLEHKNQYGFPSEIVCPEVFWRGTVKRQSEVLSKLVLNSFACSTETETMGERKYNCKCPCGSDLHSDSSDDLEQFLEQHDHCNDFDFEQFNAASVDKQLGIE